jgi:hypothetical protein
MVHCERTADWFKMVHVLCRHVVPGVGSVGSLTFYAVCKPIALP